MKKLLFPLSLLAIIILFSFAGWSLSSHGSTGLVRVMPVFLYIFIFILALGIVFTSLFFWYWRLCVKNGVKRGLFISLLLLSVIIIALFSFAFVHTGLFPPSKDITPVNQLPIPDIDRGNLRFAAGSDAHFGAGTNRRDKTLAMLDYIGNPANKYDLFFFLGDLVEYGFKDSHWKEALTAFSDVAAHVPVRFLPGNHDTLFGGLKRYLLYAGPVAEPRLWQRIDAGNVHFLLLDIEWTAETYTKEQAAWLETQLQSIPAQDWTIVMGHGFYYASGVTVMGWNWYDNPETINALTPLFEKYGVDIVFSGHNHYMELLEHAGVTYVVCGAFGGVPDPEPTYISPASLWRLQGEAGFVDVVIYDDEATLSFRGYNGDVLKSVTIIKR